MPTSTHPNAVSTEPAALPLAPESAASGQVARPPGPTCPWWGLPRLRALARDYLGEVQALQREHGDLTYMRLGAEHAYDVFDPALVRQALVDQTDHLIRWERGIQVFEQTFGQSVLVTEADTWQRQRRMLMPGFTPRRVQAYAGLMTVATARALEKVLPAGQAVGTVEVAGWMSQLTMDVILRTLFSQPEQGESGQALWATQQLSQTAMREMFWPRTLPDWLPLPGKAAKRRALRSLHGLVDRHLAARQAMPPAQRPQDDLLAMLLSVHDEASGTGLSPAELHDQCMVMFQAGHETTATTLLWWAWLMARHPEIQRATAQAVQARLGSRTPGPEDVAALDLLNAGLKEAMRLYPPIGALMTRRVLRPITLGSHRLPAGSLLRLTPWVIHRDPRWFPAPEAFRPERFLAGSPPPPRGAWLPFGTGPRVCIGQHFALLEMGLVAAQLLQRFELALPPGAPPPEPELHVTLRPKAPLHLLLRRRAA